MEPLRRRYDSLMVDLSMANRELSRSNRNLEHMKLQIKLAQTKLTRVIEEIKKAHSMLSAKVPTKIPVYNSCL